MAKQVLPAQPKNCRAIFSFPFSIMGGFEKE